MLTIADMLKDVTLNQAIDDLKSGRANWEAIGRLTGRSGWLT